jgi:uncharacterized protein
MTEVSIFLDEDDVYQSKPMHEYLMHHLLHHHIRGATVFQGLAGFGRKHHLHHPQTLGSFDERPLMIVFIDEDSSVQAVLPHIRDVVKGGLIVTKRVETGG